MTRRSLVQLGYRVAPQDLTYVIGVTFAHLQPYCQMSNPNNLPMTTSSTDSSKKTEEHKVGGEDLLKKVKEIVREGNARRITIKNDAGKVLLEIPLSLGVIGVVLAPVWIAIGTIAALAGRYTIVVEKRV